MKAQKLCVQNQTGKNMLMNYPTMRNEQWESSGNSLPRTRETPNPASRTIAFEADRSLNTIKGSIGATTHDCFLSTFSASQCEVMLQKQKYL
jgi:hypothetical protein